MSNKCLLLTRVEGGTLVQCPFELQESELSKFTKDDVLKKAVFSKTVKAKLNTRVIKIGSVYVKSLFLEDGTVYDVDLDGFKKREGYNHLTKNDAN